MKQVFCALLLSLVWGATSHAAVYNLDPAHMEVGFSVKHLMISNVKGRFDKVSGHFDYEPAQKKIKDILVEVDTNTVNTNEPDRDKHLRSPDFFDSGKFPKMTFKSDKVSFDGQKGQAHGLLTIHGKTHPVTLDFTFNGATEFMGVQKVAFSAIGKIDRKDFGLVWNKKLDKGGVAVGDEVTITIDGEANQAASTKK